MTRPYQICTRCVMDTSDPDITFDSSGVCNHCHEYDEVIRLHVRTGEAGRRYLDDLVARIKRDGAGKEYDCVIGVSGGVDSTFVAYEVVRLGLRPLAVHLDNGWDSELAVKNIEGVLKKLGIDLQTKVLDWNEFRDLQLSMLKASTPDSEVPTDHAIFSLLRHAASEHGVRYIISGGNRRTESHLPPAWSQGHSDWRYIRKVHERFGSTSLKSYPHMGFWRLRYFQRTLEWIDVLNYMDYVKRDAMKVLQEELGWRYYGGKHYESIYTRFYQGYILPRKFGYDKRRTHLSSLVCSGEITRAAALTELETEPYPAALQAEDLTYVVKKLGLTQAEFDAIMALPKRSYWDYPSYGHVQRSRPFRIAHRIYSGVKKLVRRPQPATADPVAAAAREAGD